MVCIKLSKYVEMASIILKGLRIGLSYKVLLPFYCSIAITPLLAILSIYDSVAYEYDNKSLKLLVFRLPRDTILFGKLLAPFILLTVVNFVLFMGNGLFFYLKLKDNFFFVLFLLFVFITIYDLFFLAIGLFFSVTSKCEGGALRSSLLIMIFLFIVPLFRVGWLNVFSPLRYASGVVEFIGNNYSFNFMIVSYVLYSIVILTIARFIFARKDFY